jgi:hypothetical protein
VGFLVDEPPVVILTSTAGIFAGAASDLASLQADFGDLLEPMVSIAVEPDTLRRQPESDPRDTQHRARLQGKVRLSVQGNLCRSD